MTADDVMAAIRASGKPNYTYILMRPCGEPFYVGVGTGDRLLDHEKDARVGRKKGHKFAVIRKIASSGASMVYEIASYHQDWSDAANEERRLIALYGRRDLGLGPLCNLTDGGEGAPGAIRSEAAKLAVSIAQKGRAKSLEHRELLRQANLGKKQSPETIERRSAAMRGRPRPREVVDKIVATRLANHPPKPKPVKVLLSDERRREIRVAAGRHAAEMMRGVPIPHHKNKTPEGRAKYRRPVEIGGVTYAGTDIAAETLQVGRSTIKRWLKVGTHGARRL